jgi:hypothetical protein
MFRVIGGSVIFERIIVKNTCYQAKSFVALPLKQAYPVTRKTVAHHLVLLVRQHSG